MVDGHIGLFFQVSHRFGMITPTCSTDPFLCHRTEGLETAWPTVPEDPVSSCKDIPMSNGLLHWLPWN